MGLDIIRHVGDRETYLVQLRHTIELVGQGTDLAPIKENTILREGNSVSTTRQFRHRYEIVSSLGKVKHILKRAAVTYTRYRYPTAVSTSNKYRRSKKLKV